MFIKADKGREKWVELWGREERPGVVRQESIGRLMWPQKIKGREGKKRLGILIICQRNLSSEKAG